MRCAGRRIVRVWSADLTLPPSRPSPACGGRSLSGDERLTVVPCGIGLVSRQALQPADALILAVAHKEFLALSGDALNSIMTTPARLVDVKSKLDLNTGADYLETMKM